MFLVPLGDVLDRKRLIVAMMTVAVAAAAGAAASPNFVTLCTPGAGRHHLGHRDGGGTDGRRSGRRE